MSNALAIKTARTANLNATVRSDIVRVCNDAHQTGSFNQLFSFLPPDGLHIMGYAGDEFVSHAVVTTRWLQPEGMPILRTAYVDAVATARAFQGRGFGSAVMRYLASVIANDYAIGCLETSDRVPFYTQLGWQEWRGALAGRRRPSPPAPLPQGEGSKTATTETTFEGNLIPTPDQKGIMILKLPLTPELNFDGLLTIEDQGARIW